MPSYDLIGRTYDRHRHPDPRIAARIDAALAGAGSIVNVGAATGHLRSLAEIDLGYRLVVA